jgi:hypothetical protein
MGNKTINQKAQIELKQNMEDFKKYLEQKEIELSKTTEFLAYYALPYIPNPRGHPTYEKLFKPEWTNDLKEQLQNCIKFYLPSPTKKYPVLYDLATGKNITMVQTDVNNSNIFNKEENKDNNIINSSNNKINIELKKENEKLIEELKRLKSKDEKSKIAFIDSQKTWSNLALNIISYSFGLIDIYNNAVNNATNPQVDKIRQKLIKYQNFLKKNVEELEKNKNANNSSLMVKKEEIEVIEDSMLNANNINNNNINNNINNYSLKNNNNNRIIERDHETFGMPDNSNNNNNNILVNENIINNYSRDEQENENENLQKGRSIQIDYEPENLIDMKRFISALNKK